MATPRRATGPQQVPAPRAVAQAFTMLARIHDALTRRDDNVSALRAEVAALSPPARRRPAPRHAPAARLSRRDHQPRRTARRCPRPRRRQ
jgi:hypothetical protein